MTAVDDSRATRLGDTRLDARATQITKQLAANPGLTLPEAAGSDAAAEALYRFLRNPKTSLASVIEPHLAGTATRVAAAHAAGAPLLVVHDTSILSFATDREGLGPTGEGGNGFFAHVSLAIRADAAHTPLGIAAVTAYVRRGPAKRKKHTEDTPPEERESFRWLQGIRTTKQRLGGGRAIHLGDSESDTYLTMEGALEEGERFVFRANHDRIVVTEEGGRERLSSALVGLDGLVEREVYVSDREAKKRGKQTKRKRNLPRLGRKARLRFTARKVALRRTESHAKRATLELNVVHVSEIDPPEGSEPVSWILYTTEPIETAQQVESIVDAYRARWRIEELFKALKTGCAFEDRQLESFDTITVALALFLPIACDLLALRAVARSEPERPASSVLGETVLLLLQRLPQTRLGQDATVHDAMLAIARLGGHLKQNGAPGWQVLGRGYARVLQMVEGMLLGAALTREVY